jgi:hypothetical protein
MQLDIEDQAHGFEIHREGMKFFLVDRCSFNNWGHLKIRFDTHEAAVAYAYNCQQFKIGRRHTI